MNIPLLTKLCDAVNARRLSLDEAESRYTEAIAEAENWFESALEELGVSEQDVLSIERLLEGTPAPPSVDVWAQAEPTIAKKMQVIEVPVNAATTAVVPSAKWTIVDVTEPEVAETVGVTLVRAEVHARLKARREELPLTNAQIAERIGTDRKRITNILGRPDFYNLTTLREFTAQLESLQATLTDDELLSIPNGTQPQTQTKVERRTERDEALARTRGLYERARKRFSVDQIATRAAISAKRLSNIISPAVFCRIDAIHDLGNTLEAMLAEPVAEKPLTCSVCAEPATQTTCHACITEKAAQAKREAAVQPKPRILPDPGRVVAVSHKEKPGPKPKEFVFTHWMYPAITEIESGKRTFPQGFSLIRHCIGGDVDSNVWECVPSDQPLKHHEIAYLRFTRAADMWVCNPPSIVNLAHRDAAADLLRRVVK